ncbi:uncharacterized protein N7482_010201 [Penicillium canariense]|uniref:Uncharacterized protein n=1 Tax=Penicillium canariense TaxID=189055 RepID=A0A9W9HL27_9EURO|nr:uncharacterized protein N7482_010201 [Penicillium canariense]KAJ5150949.1 hypothetical protein N7482_010201 [Penicillium canariense]
MASDDLQRLVKKGKRDLEDAEDRAWEEVSHAIVHWAQAAFCAVNSNRRHPDTPEAHSQMPTSI